MSPNNNIKLTKFGNNSCNTLETNNSINNIINNDIKIIEIGLLESISLSVGGIGLSAALFFVFPQIANETGTSVPFTLIIGTICCLTLASTICEFAKYLSNSASLFYFISQGLGKEIGFFAIWITLVGYLLISIVALLLFSGAFSEAISSHSDFEIPWIIGAIIVLLIVPPLSYVGINPVLKLSFSLMALETLVMLVVTLFIVVKGGEEGNYPRAFTPTGEYSGDLSGICKGLVYCVFIFIGFEGAVTLGRESSNPKKTIPRAVFLSVLISSTWLIWGMYSMTVACGPSNIFLIADADSPIEAYTKRFVSKWMGIVIVVMGVLSTFVVCSSLFNALIRILYSIGKYHLINDETDVDQPTTTTNKHIISHFSKKSSKFSTPHVAIIFLTIYLILTTTLITLIFGHYHKDAWKIYGYLSYIATLPIILIFILTNISIIPYIKNNQPQDYNVFKHLILPIISSLLFTGLLVGNFYPRVPQSPVTYLLIALASSILIGLLLTIYLSKKRKHYLENLIYQMSIDNE